MTAFFAGEAAAFSFAFTSILRGIGSIPAHGLWTGISGYAIGHYLSNRTTQIQQPGYVVAQESIIPHTDQAWMLMDSSGQIVKQSSTEFNQKIDIPKWLCSTKEKAISLPKNPFYAVGLAMLFHAFWNGSSWLVGIISDDVFWVFQVLMVFGWVFFLILALWQITRRILPTALS